MHGAGLSGQLNVRFFVTNYGRGRFYKGMDDDILTR